MNIMRLHDRIARALENGRGIHLSPKDLDILTLAGGYDVLSAAVAKELKEAAQKRIEERENDKL